MDRASLGSGRPSAHGGKLKVVAVSALAGTVGGGERIAFEVTRRLDPERFDRTLCISRWNLHETASTGGIPEFLEAVDEAGVKLLQIRRRSRLNPKPWLPLIRELRSTHVLHTHMFGSNVAGSVLKPLARVPVLVTHEQTWSYEGKALRRFLDRELIARATDAFIAVSLEDRRRMIEIEGIDPARITYIPNAIPTAPPGDRDRIRDELGIEANTPVVGAVGVLRPQKRFDVLIEAAGLLRDRHPDVQVLIAGPGGQGPALKAAIRERDLEGTVRMLGQRDDVADLVSAFDVAVLTSDFEGTPLVVMEYMRAGLPTVSTRVGGVASLIDDGVHGSLVPRRDPVAIAEAVTALLGDPVARARMGAAARARQQAEFDIDAMTKRIERLYEELYERRQST